jgi:hypothetical protein
MLAKIFHGTATTLVILPRKLNHFNFSGKEHQFVAWIQQISKGGFEQVVMGLTFLTFGYHGWK